MDNPDFAYLGEKRPIVSVQKIECIEIKVARGKGTPDDPCMYINQYYAIDGAEIKLIAVTPD